MHNAHIHSSRAHHFNNNNTTNRRPNTGYRGFCQWCGTLGHSAKRCPHLSSNSSPPIVNHTTVRSSTSSPWLLDSSASHHVTSDSRNIPYSTSYDGPDKIIIGNGKGLNITHIGSTSLPSSLTSPFRLRDVLCVPSISRNLISIAKFNKQNSTSIELFPDFFLIKDLTSGKVLLRGPNKMILLSGHACCLYHSLLNRL